MLSRLSSYPSELELDESRKSSGSHRDSVNGEHPEHCSQSKFENGIHGSQSNSRYSSDSEYFWSFLFSIFYYFTLFVQILLFFKIKSTLVEFSPSFSFDSYQFNMKPKEGHRQRDLINTRPYKNLFSFIISCSSN